MFKSLYSLSSSNSLFLMRLIVVVLLLGLLIPIFQTNSLNSLAISPQNKKGNNRKVRPRNIKWPEGCDSVAQEKDEYFFENACADAIRAIDNWPTDCDYKFPEDLYSDHFPELTSKIKFYALSLGKYLAKFECSSGAYNERDIFVFYDETLKVPKAEILNFKTYKFLEESTDKKEELLENVIFGKYFNRQKKELIMLRKYRGGGDCGEWARYSFSDGKPLLQEYWAKLSCDGEHAITDIKKRPIGWTKIFP
jgi:hypothetical protein